ncbi:MAG: peptidoglycan DD-metalloendopeptidase family protein [Bacteroidales bacterium]|nr:peptidoglycan DD-metalloendopeptidase family protein [Bacteroidales bacterium]
MGKKFIFNPETLSFEHSKFSLKSALKSVLPHLLVTLIFGSILGYTLFNNVKTPEYRSLEFHNENLVSNFQYLSQQVNNQEVRMVSLENNDDKVYRSVLGLKPIPQATRLLGYGGSVQTANFDFQEHEALINEVSHKSLLLQNRIKLQAESYNEILHLVKDRDELINSIPSICPLAKKDLRRIGSGFGYRMHPILHVVKMHTGVDLSAAQGVPVYATGDGIIISADASSGGYGNCIRINHGYNYITVYAHLSQINVREGELVKRGQLIGLVGSTGRSTSPHLHYEVRINNQPVNPLNFFYQDMTEEEYEEMIRQASTYQTAEEM